PTSSTTVTSRPGIRVGLQPVPPQPASVAGPAPIRTMTARIDLRTVPSTDHLYAQLARAVVGGHGAVPRRRRLPAAAAPRRRLLRSVGGLFGDGLLLRGGGGALLGALQPVDPLGKILRAAVPPPGE